MAVEMVDTVGARFIDAQAGLAQTKYQANYTAGNLASILAEDKYQTFTTRLEHEPHNHAHLDVGAGPNPVTGAKGNGHMCDGLSPLDPIFYLHHSQVDRMWAMRQLTKPTDPAMFPDTDYFNTFAMFARTNGMPAPPSRAVDSFDFRRLGYVYEDFPQQAELDRRLTPAAGPLMQAVPPAATARPAPRLLGSQVQSVRLSRARPTARVSVAAAGWKVSVAQARTLALDPVVLEALVGPGAANAAPALPPLVAVRLSGFVARGLPAGSRIEVALARASGPPQFLGALALFSRHARGVGPHAGMAEHDHSGHDHSAPASGPASPAVPEATASDIQIGAALAALDASALPDTLTLVFTLVGSTTPLPPSSSASFAGVELVVR
jgi:hypothetical protein